MPNYLTANVACVADGVPCASAFVLVAKPWMWVAKPWEDWWRVELNSCLPKLVGFFELCIHRWMQISEGLRALKHQSNVNVYLSSFLGEKRGKGLFSNTDLQMENVIKEMHTGSFGLSEYLQGKQKNYTKGRTRERFQGRAVRFPIVLWNILRAHRSAWFLMMSLCWGWHLCNLRCV